MFLLLGALAPAQHALVIQTDFGRADGAVAAMKGVAYGVDPKLAIFDLSQQNTPFDVWEAANRLGQAAPYWPTGTVFVSVVDPGAAAAQKPVVLLTRSGQYFVSPDNGTLTFVADQLGIQAVRAIDEAKHRRPGAEQSYVARGRDVCVYTGAQLASGQTTFADIGPLLPPKVVTLEYEKARRDGDALIGNIPALDEPFGNVWTNIDGKLFAQLHPKLGEFFHVTITQGDEAIYEDNMPYQATFADVDTDHPLLYVNDVGNMAVALNHRSFAKENAVESGPDWRIRIEKTKQ